MLACSGSTTSLSSADDEHSQRGPACEAKQLFQLLERTHLDAATEASCYPAVQPTGASPALPELRPYNMINPLERQIEVAPEGAASKVVLAATLIRKTTAEPLQPNGQLRPAGQPISATEEVSASAKLVLQPTNVWHKSQNMSQPVQLTDSSTNGLKSTASSPAGSAKPAWENCRKRAAGVRGDQKRGAQSQSPKVPPGKSTKSSDGTKTCTHIRKEPMQPADGISNTKLGHSSQISAAVAAASGRLGLAPGCCPAAPSAHGGRASANRANKPAVRSMDARELPFKCEKASLVAANARHRLAGQQSPAPLQPACTPAPESSQYQPTEQLPSCTVPSSLSQAQQAAALARKGDPEAAGEPGLNSADPVIDDILADISEQDWPSYLTFIKTLATGPSPCGASQPASDDAAEPDSAESGSLPLRAVACAGIEITDHLITSPRLSPPIHSLPSAYQEPHGRKASAGLAVTAGTAPQREPQPSSSQQQAASTAWRTAEERREPLQEPTASATELHAGRTARLSEQPGARLGSCGGEQPGSQYDSMMLSLQGAIDRLQQAKRCADNRLLAGDDRVQKDALLDAVAKELLQEQGSGTVAAGNGQNASQQEARLAMLAGTDVSSQDCPGRVSQQDVGTAADTDL